MLDIKLNTICSNNNKYKYLALTKPYVPTIKNIKHDIPKKKTEKSGNPINDIFTKLTNGIHNMYIYIKLVQNERTLKLLFLLITNFTLFSPYATYFRNITSAICFI